ncbi:hypothetical protein BRADI_3g59315v3 [Brachypodium distachyon]|uniref:Uncharacterized protein n=1 Tax=Brachypodium distachyon TaxID=15368 RepID=A0A2K2D5T9_BRADI|nr:hypothetical protein BRADI_3g59315v3 [Brachypodium distachyon]
MSSSGQDSILCWCSGQNSAVSKRQAAMHHRSIKRKSWRGRSRGAERRSMAAAEARDRRG